MRTLSLLLIAAAAVIIATSFVAADLFESLRSNNKNKIDNPFSFLCERNPKLCDELNTLGIHRHDMVPELGVAFWRTTLEAAFKELYDAAASSSPAALAKLHDSALFKKFVAADRSASGSNAWVDTVTHTDTAELRAIVKGELSAAKDATGMPLFHENPVEAEGADAPWFGFVPKYFVNTPIFTGGSAGAAYIPATRCSTGTIVTASLDSSGTNVDITLESNMSSSRPALCADYWLFSVGPSSIDATIMASGKYKFALDVSKSMQGPNAAALRFDLENKGLRIFRNAKSKLARTLDTIDTLMLFLPMITGKLDAHSAEANAKFFNSYTLLPHSVSYSENIKLIGNFSQMEALIEDFDCLQKSELDGLGPIEGLVQGTAAGHWVTALRDEHGILQMCESIIPGVTCTSFPEWISALNKSGMQISIFPLKPELRAKANKTAAWAKIRELNGNQYGFQTVLVGFIDTVTMNFPYFPPFPITAHNRKLSAESMELLMFHLDEIVHPIVRLFVIQMLEHRTGLFTGADVFSFAQVLEAGAKKNNMTFGELMAVPENDSWLYNATNRDRKGTFLLPSRVCSALGMTIFQAAGIVDASLDVQATEMGVWDMGSLNFWDDTKLGKNRPEICKLHSADKSNTWCALNSGPFTFSPAPEFNTRAAWKHMNLVCDTLNPYPYNHDGCYKP